MTKIFKDIADFQARSRRVFTEGAAYAAAGNRRVLPQAAWGLFFFLLIYNFVTTVMMDNATLRFMYVAFWVIDGVFLLVMHLWKRANEPKCNGILCMVFMLILTGFSIAISVFPYPQYQGIFYPVGYMLTCVLFMLPYRYAMGELTVIAAVYFILVRIFKAPDVIKFDSFVNVTAWILSFFEVYVITDLRLRYCETNIKLAQLSRTDSLTDLPNRRAMDENMAAALRRCQRNEHPVAAVMMDVDDFKAYNDNYGHRAGDDCLKALGGVLNAVALDWGVLVARYGGDEFCIFMPDYPPARAEQVVADLKARTQALCLESVDCPVNISAGLVTVSRCEGWDLMGLFNLADRALYRAKEKGKNGTEVWAVGEGEGRESAPDGEPAARGI